MNERQKIIIALKKARTSLDKIITRIEMGGESAQCFDVLQQTLSVIGLLKNANNHILEQHLNESLARFKGKKLTQVEIEKIRSEVVRVVQTAQKK